MPPESGSQNKGEVSEDLLEEMRQKEKELLEKKVQLIEEDLKRHKRRRMRYSALVPIIAAIVGALGGLAGSYYHYRGTEKEMKQKYLAELVGSSYDTQYQKLKEIAELSDIETAFKVAYRFRTGATIRALEEMKKDASESLREEISDYLDSLEKVLIIDSTASTNVYNEYTKALGGSNVDDIAEIIREEPIRIIGRKVTNTWTKKDEKECIDLRPQLIIMHWDAFEGVNYEPKLEEPIKSPHGVNWLPSCYLLDFINSMNASNRELRFIVYSRKNLGKPGDEPSDMTLYALKGYWIQNTKDETLGSRMSLLHIEPKSNDFSDQESKGKITTAVHRAFDFDRLYRPSWEYIKDWGLRGHP